MCYGLVMATEYPTRKSGGPEVDSAATDDLPALSDEERIDFLRTLQEAEAEIAAGNFIVGDSATFKARLDEIGRQVRRTRGR